MSNPRVFKNENVFTAMMNTSKPNRYIQIWISKEHYEWLVKNNLILPSDFEDKKETEVSHG